MSESQAVAPQEEIPGSLLEDLELKSDEFSPEVALEVLASWFPEEDFTSFSEGQLLALFSALPAEIWRRGKKVTFKDLYLVSTHSLLKGEDQETAARRVGMTSVKLEWWRELIGKQIAGLLKVEDIHVLAGPRLELAESESNIAEPTSGVEAAGKVTAEEYRGAIEEEKQVEGETSSENLDGADVVHPKSKKSKPREVRPVPSHVNHFDFLSWMGRGSNLDELARQFPVNALIAAIDSVEKRPPAFEWARLFLGGEPILTIAEAKVKDIKKSGNVGAAIGSVARKLAEELAP